MTVRFDYGLDYIQDIMKTCIESEICENGLLEDVESFIPIYYEKRDVEEPCIWMSQHPTTAERQADISQTMDLTTPFEFDCAVYAPEMEDAVNLAQNLAGRVTLSIVKNYLKVQSQITEGKRLIKKIGLETYYPVGYVSVTGKSDNVPVIGVVLNVTHTVNWKMCCKELQNQGD